MRILGLSDDMGRSIGGCLHYRLVLPFAEFSRAGYDVEIAGSIALSKSGEIGGALPGGDQFGFDVVVMQRWMNERSADIIRRAQACGQVVVNDIDDWLFGVPTANAAFSSTHVKVNPEHNIGFYRKVLAASDALTVSTPYLAERLKPLGRPVYVLRNMIDLERWNVRDVEDTYDPDLGWVGSVSHRSPGDLPQLAGVVGPFLERHRKSEVVHVGAIDFGQVFSRQASIPWERVTPVSPTSLRMLPFAMENFDVALAPLEDTPFNHAKSYIKALEASAAGIPVITSDMPEYRFLGAGIQAKSPKGWSLALERLSDPRERRAFSAAGRARAEQLDIADHWKKWESVYGNLAGYSIKETSIA